MKNLWNAIINLWRWIPTNTYAYKGRGSLYTALNRFAEAEADLNQALEYAPDDADAKQRLDFLHKKQELVGRS